MKRRRKSELTLAEMQKAIDWVESHRTNSIGWVWFNGNIYTDPDEFLKAYYEHGRKVADVLRKEKDND